MKKKLILSIFISFFAGNILLSQEFKSFNFEELEPTFHHTNDTTYVINFWAMWCKPCVEELPEIEHIRKAYQDKKVKILLVSLDFGKNVEARLTTFLKKKKIGAEVVVLDDPDSDNWIGKVDNKWDGALPATVIYKKNKKKFFARQINYAELAETIDQISH